MIKFNTILESESIDPAQIKLVRHKAEGLYQLWLRDKDGFERWQQFQAGPEFSGAAIIASFVASPFGETVFVGLYSVNGVGDLPHGFTDPLTAKEVGEYNTVTGKLLAAKHIFYDLSPMQKLKDYEGKLLIDWGKGYLAWTQWAKNQNKHVLEIRRVISEPVFPGYLISELG